MKQIGMIGTCDSLRERLAEIARLASAQTTSSDTRCSGCEGTGWVRHEQRVYACVCGEGQKKPVTVKSIRDVTTAEELAQLFPAGVPKEAIGTALRLEAMGVGRRESRYTFETYRQRFAGDKVLERHLAVAQLWVKTEPAKRSDLVMFGSHGRGKTGLAVAIARALVDNKETLHFTEGETIAARIRGTYGGGDNWHEPGERESELSLVKAFQEYATLIIDEVTGVKLTEFVDDKMRAIVTGRQRQERATILTLNVDGGLAQDSAGIEAALARMLGPALYDRLAEQAQWLAMFGASTRGRK